MVIAKSLGTGNIPLKLAKRITEIARKEWEDETLIEKVSPTTKDLLKYWDPNGNFGYLRPINFHEGQWQAILNTIYIHEVLKPKNILDIYMAVDSKLLEEMEMLDLKKEKYDFTKYCIKMATGTGKTWVLSALLIWQFLNARHEEEKSNRFTKNFLLIAPGIIVYERLLDAYLGKRKLDNTRDFDTSDFKKFEDLFIPQNYKDEIFGFVQSSVVQKDEIGRKITGDGFIGVTNWHLLAGEKEEDDDLSPLDMPHKTIKKIFPIMPGTTAGHSLDVLDNQYFYGKEMDYLAKMPDIMIFNDEAHHLGESKKSDEVIEKKWQESITYILKNKKYKSVQVDFSATPYSVTGSEIKRTKHHFPHIIVNFELPEAIKLGLVKTVAIDKRKEITAMPLEDLNFKAEKDGKTVSLSDGQRKMIRAGITKLNILEKSFTSIDPNKHPKMLIVCENTSVVPEVTTFLVQEGMSPDDVVEIHSNKKGEVGNDEWDRLKQRLFDVDKHSTPKIIVSVLMLREGFDVSNICVIVPLRSSSSYILLEQLIGRGLRLMWREPQYTESKNENREKLLIKKEEPENQMDILSIIEHPKFIEFYDKELSGAFGIIEKPIDKGSKTTGDIINVDLKENYQDYEFFWPIILHDKEEFLVGEELSIKDLEPFGMSLEELKPFAVRDGDVFYGEELTVKTKFGEYSVTADIFTAKSYNSFIQKVVNGVTEIPVKLRKKQQKYPTMQINTHFVANLVDTYIRQKLFGHDFDPLIDNNWKFLVLVQGKIIQHIVKNVSQVIYNLQNKLDVVDATVNKRYFSEINQLKIRETYSINVAKTIFDRIGYPSNKGGFEKAFIEFIDSDSKIKAFMKINENFHNFATILYIREDGMLAHYFPDFLVKIENQIYVVETKADRDLNNINVKQKRLAAIDWVEKINELKIADRDYCEWHYVIVSENTFYDMKDRGADTKDILQYSKRTKAMIKGTLSDFIGVKEY